MTDDPDLDAIAAALAAPFDPSEIKFRPGATNGNRALALPYVDARVVQDRLDDVLGVMNWSDQYECLPDGSVVCRLTVRVGGREVTKTDVGGQSEQPDEGDRRKAAFSDALKRAAVKYGVARYLYQQKPIWADYDPVKKRFTAAPVPPGQPPARQSPPAAPTKPASGNADPHEKLKAFDADLVHRGYCRQGELLQYVTTALEKRGHGADPSGWSAEAWDVARKVAKRFEADRGPATPDEVAALTREFERTGETAPRLMAKLGVGKDSAVSDLSSAQVRWAIGILKGLCDRVPAKA